MRKILTVVTVVAGIVPFTVRAQDQPHQASQTPSALVVLEQSPFPQQKVTDCTTPATWNGAKISYDDGELTIAGIDSERHSWVAHIPAQNVFTCEVWSAKLHQGSSGDLIIANRGNSFDFYDTELTVLYFGPQGLPMPWQARGAFSFSKDGIAEVVKADGAGNGGIVVPSRIGDRVDGYVYVYQLVMISDTGVHRFSGPSSSGTWPLITGDANLLSVMETANALSEDAGDVVFDKNKGVLLKSVQMPGLGKGLGGVQFSDNSDELFPAMLVVDSAEGNREIFPSQDVTEKLASLAKQAYKIRVIGQTCEEEECGPLLMVATQQNSAKHCYSSCCN
jgi:hypothetical protein